MSIPHDQNETSPPSNTSEKEDSSQEYYRLTNRRAWKVGGLIFCVIVLLTIVFVAGSTTLRNHNTSDRYSISNRGYYGMMSGGRGGYGMMGSVGERDVNKGRGLSGNITSTSSTNVTITTGTTSQSVVVNIASATSIYKANGDIAKQSDLQTGNNIVVVGAPQSDGTVSATAIFIR